MDIGKRVGRAACWAVALVALAVIYAVIARLVGVQATHRLFGGVGGWIGTFVGPRSSKPEISFMGLLTAGALGGIGFTVSLLMNDLAFAGDPLIRNEGTLAVLLGSGISIVLSGILVSRLAAQYRRGKRAVVEAPGH